MDKTLELVLAIMSVVFVLYTAVIDPKASLIVAVVAVICFIAYRMMFNKKVVRKVVAKKSTVKKAVAKKTVKNRRKK